MVTKAQAVAFNEAFGRNTELHYTGRHECTRKVGPRGGVTERIVKVRVSGKCQTWKTRPDEFRLPVKHGMYESGAITERNAADFHTSADCPLNHATLETLPSLSAFVAVVRGE